MSDDDVERLDDLDVELLVEDHWAAFKPDLDAEPLGAEAWSVRGYLREAEEVTGEESDGVRREQLVELLLVAVAREHDWHEGEFEHGVALLVGPTRLLDLVERRLDDSGLATPAEVGHLVSEEAEHWREVDDRVVAEAFEQVEQDLLVARLVPAVRQEALHDLAVQFLQVEESLATHVAALRRVVNADVGEAYPAVA